MPLFDEVIVTTKRMRNIVSFDEFSGVLVCVSLFCFSFRSVCIFCHSAEAGCILENLDNYLAAQGFMMPLDLGAKGRCGTVSSEGFSSSNVVIAAVKSAEMFQRMPEACAWFVTARYTGTFSASKWFEFRFVFCFFSSPRSFLFSGSR